MTLTFQNGIVLSATPAEQNRIVAAAAIKLNGHRFGRSHWCLTCRWAMADLLQNPDRVCTFVVHKPKPAA